MYHQEVYAVSPFQFESISMISPSFLFCVGHLVGWQAEKFTQGWGTRSSYLHCIRNDLLVQFSAFLDQMLPQMLEGKTIQKFKSQFLGQGLFWGSKLQGGIRGNTKILKYLMVLVNLASRFCFQPLDNASRYPDVTTHEPTALTSLEVKKGFFSWKKKWMIR